MQSDLQVISTLIICAFCVFAPHLNNPFIWDDQFQILNNLHVKNSQYLHFFSSSTFTNSDFIMQGNYYKPIMSIWNTFLFHIGNGSPIHFHVAQLVFYMTNSFFIFKLATFFSPKTRRLPLFMLILFFSFHPINLENIFYIANIQDVLFMFFGLFAFYLLVQYQDIKTTRLLLLGSLLLLSLFSKETGFAFILLMPIYTFFHKKPFFIRICACSLTVLMIYFVFRLGFANLPIHTQGGYGLMVLSSIKYRLMSIPSILEHYFLTLFYIKDISLGYHWVTTQFTWELFYRPLSIMTLLLILLVYFKNKLDPFLSIWICIGLVIHSQIIPLDFTVANRWFYFTFTGIILAITRIEFIENIYFKYSLSLFLFFNIYNAYHEGFYWKSEYSLYEKYLERNSHSFDLQHNLGFIYLTKNDYKTACEYIQKSYTLNPNWWVSQNNLGVCYHKKADFPQAEKFYLMAINSAKYKNSFFNLMHLYKKTNRIRDLKKIQQEFKIFYP